MLTIEAKNIYKKFNQLSIIHDFSYRFSSDKIYGIVGNNGSGKSTLLKIIAGYLTANKGQISFQLNKTHIPIEEIYKQLSFCAPYIDLIDDFTTQENISFHFAHKNCLLPILEHIKDILELPMNKRVKDFSSGMKQKLKLTMSILTDSRLLLIDEPGSFLDTNSKKHFQTLLNTYQQNRLIIIASNEKNDLESCTELLNIEDYKNIKLQKQNYL